MSTNASIKSVHGREVLDSRGRPTVEVDIRLSDGSFGRAMVPSGASTGKHEAVELRDGDADRYNGFGVSLAVRHVNDILGPALIASEADSTDQRDIDNILLELDGTDNKANIGANAILGVSLANARAAAEHRSLPLYRHINYLSSSAASPRLPMITVNMISGGAHGGNNLDMQDFLITPVGAPDYKTSLEWSFRVREAVGVVLTEKGHHSHVVADEGGLAPFLKSHTEALDVLIAGIKLAGLTPGRDQDVAIAMDVAATEFYVDGEYVLNTEGQRLSSCGMTNLLKEWIQTYPIVSIEDALDEDDWDGWNELTSECGQGVQLIGDDLFTTNADRLRRGIKSGTANSVLVKLNQIGTLTETIDLIDMAVAANYIPVVSARSGETEDTFIADLAVGTAAPQFKVGSTTRSERTAKWNQLLRIEEELDSPSEFIGRKAFTR
ncbi:MAG: phosphopyruvate hydratase [Dehalococcoidia bacterium]